MSQYHEANDSREVMVKLATYIVQQVKTGDQSIPLDTTLALAQRVLQLDQYLSRGGVLPDAWRGPGMVSGSAYLAPF